MAPRRHGELAATCCRLRGRSFSFFDLSVCVLSHADTSPYEGEAILRCKVYLKRNPGDFSVSHTSCASVSHLVRVHQKLLAFMAKAALTLARNDMLCPRARNSTTPLCHAEQRAYPTPPCHAEQRAERSGRNISKSARCRGISSRQRRASCGKSVSEA